MSEEQKPYTIGRECGEPFIWCHTCNRRSFNKNDVVNLYCGYCRKYHPHPIDELLNGLESLA